MLPSSCCSDLTRYKRLLTRQELDSPETKSETNSIVNTFRSCGENLLVIILLTMYCHCFGKSSIIQVRGLTGYSSVMHSYKTTYDNLTSSFLQK